MRYDTLHDSILTLDKPMIDSATREAIERIMVDPKFARNIRGRLVAALRLLDAPLQARLACDYAEHVVWICEQAFNGDPLFCHAIRSTKGFLNGQTSIEEVAQARSDLYQTIYRLPKPLSMEMRIAAKAVSIIKLAIGVSCQRELEALGAMIRVRHQPQAKAVASQAWYAVGHYVGGEDWDSDDPQLKAAARKRGKAASDAEVEWQINRLVEYIGLERRYGQESRRLRDQPSRELLAA